MTIRISKHNVQLILLVEVRTLLWTVEGGLVESGEIDERGSWLGIVGNVVRAGVRVRVRAHSGVGKEVGRVVEEIVTIGGGGGVRVGRVQFAGVSS